MRATGIVRRIDNLGRIVVPKELQRGLKLKEGDALEVFMSNDCLILKKYKEVNTNADRIRNMSDEELLDFLCSIRTYENDSAMTIENEPAMCSVTDVEDWLKSDAE